MALDIPTLRRRLQEALGDQLSVGELLGEGGFAAVFRVRERAANRDVAVKVLDLGLTPSPALAERFVREARTSAQLVHPHIVPIYKVGGYQNEVLYIIMRCLDGPSLRRLLEQQHQLSLTDAARIARQVADALGHAHRRHVVHRDVKPDNILLDHAGHVLVTDFGIAKAAQEASVSQLTTEGMVVGTPHYMSPEQAMGERVDQRSDIYALGVVLYQMLAGVPPFDGDSAQAVLMKQATATPVPLAELRKDVAPALAAVVERMLAKNPADRFQTADAVSRALVEAVPSAAQDRVRLHPSGLPSAVRGLVSVAVTGGFLVVAVVVGAVALGRQPRLSGGAPVADSVAQALRRQRALAPDDSAEYVFAPRGTDDATVFLVARRAIAVLAPRHVRVYPRDSVRVRYGVDLRNGLRFRLWLALPRERRDTAFQALSLRDLYELTPHVWRLVAPSGGRWEWGRGRAH